MTTLAAPRDRVKAARYSRPFGEGILEPARRPAGRGPSGADLAYEAGRTAGLDAEHDVEPPAHYGDAERAAFLDGLEAAQEVIADRYAAQVEEAERASLDIEWSHGALAGCPWEN